MLIQSSTSNHNHPTKFLTSFWQVLISLMSFIAFVFFKLPIRCLEKWKVGYQSHLSLIKRGMIRDQTSKFEGVCRFRQCFVGVIASIQVELAIIKTFYSVAKTLTLSFCVKKVQNNCPPNLFFWKSACPIQTESHQANQKPVKKMSKT